MEHGTLLFRAYVDETGDLGMKPTSSEHFTFAAVVCKDSHERILIQELDNLVKQFGRPPEHVLHWARNLKRHEDRKHISRALSKLPVTLFYMVVPKINISAENRLMKSAEELYNHTARLLLERLGYFSLRYQNVREPSLTVKMKVTFGKVKGLDAASLPSYINMLRSTSQDACWTALTPSLEISSPSVTRALQWADAAAGAFDSAIRADEFGDYEEKYLKLIRKRINRNTQGLVLDYGIKVLGSSLYLTQRPWWRPRMEWKE